MIQITCIPIKYLKLQIIRHGRKLVVEISIVGTISLMGQLSDMIENLFPYIAVSIVFFCLFCFLNLSWATLIQLLVH